MTVNLKAGEKLTISFEDTDREVEVSYLDKEFDEPRIKVTIPDQPESKGMIYHETFVRVL